jgi:hypothetical protein
MVAGAGSHMAAALRQVFPADFLPMALARAKVARAESRSLLRVLNADGLFAGSVASEPRAHTVVLRRTHPLQFTPFLYEGLDEARRTRFKREDISMRLVALKAISLPDIGNGFPGPLRLRVKFPTVRPGGEPLLSSGETGKANFVYVQYPDETHIRIGYDCWGLGALLSAPIAIDYAREHEVVVSCGAQLPPGGPPSGLSGADWARLHATVMVAVDGVAVLADRAPTIPAEARTLFVGLNVAGGSTANAAFSGEIRRIERAAWSDVLGRLPLENLAADELARQIAAVSPNSDWSGYPGPIQMLVRFPQGPAGLAEPLLVSGKTGAGDIVFVRYLGDGRVRFGFDHWGVGGPESEPVRLGESRRIELVVSHGGLMPAAGPKPRVGSPELGALRESVVIAVDDRVVLVAPVKAYPTAVAGITAGRNAIGGSTTTAQFSGEIFAVRSAPAEAVLKLRASGTTTR